MRQAWEQYQASPEMSKPKDEPPLPPVIYMGGDEEKQNVPYFNEDVVSVVQPISQSMPIVPIKEVTEPITNYFVF